MPGLMIVSRDEDLVKYSCIHSKFMLRIKTGQLEPLLKQSQALPLEALPLEALPSELLPLEALPSDALPLEALIREDLAPRPTCDDDEQATGGFEAAASRKQQLSGISTAPYLDNRSDPRSDGSSSGDCEVPLVFTNAVHIAIDCGAADVLRLLLRYGVPPDRPGVPVASAAQQTSATSKSAKPSPKVSPTGLGSEVLDERTRDMKLNFKPDTEGVSARQSCGVWRDHSKRSPCEATTDLRPEFEERKMRYRQEEELRKRQAMAPNYDEEIKKRETANEKLRRDIEEAMRIRDLEEKRRLKDEEEEEKRKALEAEEGKDKFRSNGREELESISEGNPMTIPEDPSLEDEETGQEKRDGDDKKTVSRRVSWVPEVAEKSAGGSREKPAYKRRHSAIVRRAVVTFQRQRSFSLDSQQQQVRETDGVVSEGATVRLTDPIGERNRSQPRYFTFTQAQPWEPSRPPNMAGHRSASSRFSSQGPAAGEGSAKLLILNTSIAQDRLTVCCDGGGRRSFAEVYTRDHLYSLPPLFLAACKGNTAITYLLLKYGAAALVVDPLGNTPLHLAVCQRSVNWESVLDLLEFGASITLRNSMGTRPLDLHNSLARLQEQLVTDCFAVFEPPTRAEPEAEAASQREQQQPAPKQASSLFKRLQGVASRDKGTSVNTAGAGSKGRASVHTTNSSAGAGGTAGVHCSSGGRVSSAGVGGTATAPSATSGGGSIVVGGGGSGTSRDMDELSLASTEAVLHPSGSVRSRSSVVHDQCLELTLEDLSQLGNRRRLRKLHEEGMETV
ncbi:uncharacterized protein LOC125177706 [Hyalella azteca]|uniref:Uncharacterized protein LOC125177706 n=1 Tax=Hyalella azteca TaxID=294128 RepID=A0A979FHW2_HYAAZ|nr:uncharacterized protein LOC125177706 [Hyalella azteca]